MFSYFLLFLLSFYFFLTLSDDITQCSSSETCTSTTTVPTNETFGQKLLRIQSNRYSYISPGQTKSDASNIRVKNPNNEAYEMFWYNHNNGESVYNGKMKPKGTKSTNSYIGHTFYFTKVDNHQHEIYRFTVKQNVNMYLIPLDKITGDKKLYKILKDELDFNKKYLKENGRPWVTTYPRPTPILPIWPAQIGQIHTVHSNQSFWNCIPEKDTPEERSKCQSKDPIIIKIECISIYPKIFVIENTISLAEADLIINLSTPKIHRSLAGQDGGLVTNTRTSSNAWLDRNDHFVMDTIYRRAADILNISESLLWSHKNMENLQVVHYDADQEYSPHYDFGADGRIESRFLTLLYYLNDQASPSAGGETSFPKANNEKGLAIHPGKGNSVLFYSLLEDGNGDDFSLHSGSRVREGDKWIANFWVWDPHR